MSAVTSDYTLILRIKRVLQGTAVKQATVCPGKQNKNNKKTIRGFKENLITYVAILHGSDVRPEATICRGQDGLHATLQLIERHCKICEVVHLWKEEKELGILHVCFCKMSS